MLSLRTLRSRKTLFQDADTDSFWRLGTLTGQLSTCALFSLPEPEAITRVLDAIRTPLFTLSCLPAYSLCFFPTSLSDSSNMQLFASTPVFPSHYTPSPFLSYILLSSMLIHSILTSPLSYSSASSLITAFNVTMPRPPSRRAYVCTNSALFHHTAQRAPSDDCKKALQRFKEAEIDSRQGEAEFEFVALGASQKTSFPKVELPRKYEHGK